MKLISQGLPSSNYDSDKKQKDRIKDDSLGLQQINEETDVETDHNMVPNNHPKPLNKKRVHRHPKVRNDVFASKDSVPRQREIKNNRMESQPSYEQL